jgi:hypothetical protein
MIFVMRAVLSPGRYEAEWSELVVSHDVHLRLEALLQHEDATVVRYASGALKNITRALKVGDLSATTMEAVKMRTLLKRREEWLQRRARERIENAVKKMPLELRLEREVSGRRSIHSK